jgi:ATP-dependent exoDNAse (exonuclease V) beta subunit
MPIRTATEWAASMEEGAAPLPRPSEPAADSAVQRGLFDEPSAAPKPTAQDSALAAVAIVDARGPERPGGARFGELVHALLASAPLDAGRAAIDRLAEVHGRVLSAPADEVAAACETVERILAHELISRAIAAERRGMCRREVPVTYTLPDGTLIEGVVDLAFEEPAGWTVVDYKTDREMAAAGEERYRRQVLLYVAAITQASGRPAAGALVRI